MVIKYIESLAGTTKMHSLPRYAAGAQRGLVRLEPPELKRQGTSEKPQSGSNRCDSEPRRI
jgi:hypothetical protein